MEQIIIPENMIRYLREHDGVNITINYNHADADHGYAHVTWRTVVLSRLTRHCNNCGYDPLWNPDDSESRCGHHVYSTWHYDPVFVWGDMGGTRDKLEKCFELWEKEQPKENEYRKPAKYMSFGKTRWE